MGGKPIIILTDNLDAVSCDCPLCKMREVVAEAMALNTDREILLEIKGGENGKTDQIERPECGERK